ncbi:RNA-binding cell elongation regulator Jag/EloR [Candidatus Villigracilis saccharophilus]|uniref:RNA-binding cell elongation regulator Jag/EloR n=1 Tax=Candidatus Villigracilis saccharophilus TaxID=3140684 RepID=UPI00313600AB|nr:Jag N-terminal domain-containing protein [Anaerolineales bacterium]
MSDRTTLEIIAPTVEEALSQGLSQLGLTADAVSVEVLDSGSKGLFGLGGRQVRVRLTVNPLPGEYVSEAPSKPKAAEKAAVSSREPKPASAKKTESAPKVKVREPKPARPAAAKKPEQEEAVPVPVRKVERHEPDPVLDATEEIVSKLIHHLGMKAQVSANFDEKSTDDRRTIHVDVRGDNLSALIGRQAETLNAFQYVASLIVGKQTQQWVQLVVDVEGYRERREKQVRQVALRMVEQVLKTGRKATLEPMTANERRVIHIELRGHPGVTTESTGEEPHRKVVILPKE